MELGDLPHRAGRLVSYGLRPKLNPATDDEYRELVALYRGDDRFRQLVDGILAGLGLRATYADKLGFYLAAEVESPFAYNVSDFRRERGTSDVTGVRMRGLYAIAAVGIAAYFYPQVQHLADEYHRPATSAQIEGFVRAACENLRARLGDEDPEQQSLDDEPAWKVVLRQKEVTPGVDGRRGQQGTKDIVEKLLEVLAEQQLVRRQSDGRGGTRYQPLERFRLQVANFAGDELYEALSQHRQRRDQPITEAR